MKNILFKETLILISVLVCAEGTNLAIGDSPSIGGFNVYYGQLHSHTNISDGQGSPSEAYAYARDTAGLDFFSITDHDYWFDDMTQTDWDTIKDTANSYNDDGTYVTFWGFEWTSDFPEPGYETLTGKGHITIINSDDWCNATEELTNELDELVNWLDARDVVAFFNHPGMSLMSL